MNIVLWVLQILLAVQFLIVGIAHFVLPPGLPEPITWMYDLAPALHWFSGTAEILAAIGLILPSLTRVRPMLTPLAAAGLVLVMIGAMVFHFTRAEFINIGSNLVLAALSAFVAYGRWRLHPIETKKGPGRPASARQHSPL